MTSLDFYPVRNSPATQKILSPALRRMREGNVIYTWVRSEMGNPCSLVPGPFPGDTPGPVTGPVQSSDPGPGWGGGGSTA